MLEILYEDNHILVLNKPAGLLTQPSPELEKSLETDAKDYMRKKYSKKGGVFLHAVHRLDKPASGIVLFAKTQKALSRLNEAIRQKKWNKTYLAICEGVFEKKEGTLELYLAHGDQKAKLVQKEEKGAKPSLLSYRVISSKDDLSLIEVLLFSGRYHQIRVSFQTICHPILGDHKYGAKKSFAKESIALHHHRLEIIHPVTLETLLFEAPLPKSWPISGQTL